MPRIPFAAAILAVLLASATLHPPAACADDARPNFVFILVDDLGYNDVGCYGSTFYETPNVDRLAASGLKFTDGYAAHPVCSPTRAAIMTGKNPARVGITDWIPGQNPRNRKLRGPDDLHALPLEEVTIAERLKAAGYSTFFAGKWHLGSEGAFPEDQGFDVNIGGHHRGSPPGGYYSPYKNPKLADGPEGEYLPDRLTAESLRFIETHRDKPFLVYLSFYTVHTPIQASRRHLRKYNKKAAALPLLDGKPTFAVERDGWTKLRQDSAAYASMVEAMDENVGRVLDTLEKLELDERTVVIFTSDNGGLSTLRRRGAPTSTRPLRAGKGWCYEGGIRVPFIVRAPGVVAPGSKSAVPVYSADLYPTMLELAGLRLDAKQHVDAVSLVPILKGGDTLERDFIVWHFPHYHGSTWTPGSAIRAGRWKLIEFYDEKKIELYDLQEDIGERDDLATAKPELATKLRESMQKYLSSVDAKYPTPNPDFGKPRDERKGGKR